MRDDHRAADDDRERGDAGDAHDGDREPGDAVDGEYYGEPYGSRGDGRFDWFWFAITWLTVPLLIAYMAYRVLT